MTEKGSKIPPPANEPPFSSALASSLWNLAERDEHSHSQSSNRKQRSEATDNKIPHKSESLEEQPTIHSSQSTRSPSHALFENKNYSNMVQPKPKGILVKRSVSEGPPNKDHGNESSHHRQSSLSLGRVLGSNNNSSIRVNKSSEKIGPRPSMQTAPVAAVQTQSAIWPQRKLRIMNAEWNEEDIGVTSSSFTEQAIPRRTVSFAPVHEIRQSSISESGSPTPSVRHPNLSFRTDLPRVLQAGIRPDTPERQGIRPGPPAPTPRQLALWEEEELGSDGYGQGGHFERPLRTAEEAQIHLKMLDERMKKIANEGTWSNPGVLGHATPGYVAGMRRQQYANAYTSFRHPQRGLSKNSGASRRWSLLISCDSEPFRTDAN
jgi:hypothetical protein